MRIFLFLIFISISAFAQIDVGDGSDGNCTDITFASPAVDNTYQCLTVAVTNLATGDLNDSSLPLTIKSQGTISIASISFEGGNGATGISMAGGTAGPGGGGGGNYFGSAESGIPAPQGGRPPLNSSLCPTAATDTAEASGGGGGSLTTQGQNGSIGLEQSAGGIIFSPGAAGSIVNINNLLLVAGAGGGTGEVGCRAPNDTLGQDPGTGGGGGGGLRLIAAGDISITGLINVSGGNGGDGLDLGSGGGGGSGGFVIIQTHSQINITGSIDATLGTGGTNGSPGGAGGNGAHGLVLLEDLDGSVPGTVLGPTPIIRPIGGTPSSSSSLKSNIACGSVGKKNDQEHLLLQMIMGFSIAFFLRLLIKTLSRFRMLLSLMSAFLN